MRLAILLTTLLAILFNFVFTGSYVDGQSTYWIGGYSTSISFVLLTVITFAIFGIGWKRTNRAARLAYFVTWLALMGFSAWIVSHPENTHLSSTASIGVVFSAAMYALYCGSIFVVVFAIACLLPQSRQSSGAA